MFLTNNMLFISLPFPVIWHFLAIGVQGSGFVEIKLKTYRNQNGTDDRGFCCEKDSERTNCAPCDPYIEAYLVLQNATSANASNIFTSGVFNDSNYIPFGTEAGSFNLTFGNFSNKFILVLNVWDDDGVDLVSSPNDKLETLLFNVGQGEPSPFYTRPPLVFKQITGKATTIELEYRISCDQYFYGNCGKYCQQTPGQYNCSSAGDKVCETGWTGSGCDIIISTDGCQHNKCEHNSTCAPWGSTGYQCTCTQWFTGTFCETTVTQTTSSFVPLTRGNQISSTKTNVSVESVTTQGLPSNEKGSPGNTGIIVGATVGAIATLAAAIVSVFIVRKILKKKKKNRLAAK